MAVPNKQTILDTIRGYPALREAWEKRDKSLFLKRLRAFIDNQDIRKALNINRLFKERSIKDVTEALFSGQAKVTRRSVLKGAAASAAGVALGPRMAFASNHPVGYEVLEIERPVGAGDQDAATLKHVIEGTIEDLQREDIHMPVKEKGEAKRVLEIIQHSLRRQGFSITQRSILFHHALRNKTLDCDHAVFLFLSIAEKIGLPLVAVLCPAHLFIRWPIPDGTHLNWETLHGKLVSDERYVQGYNISQVSLEKGVYLRSLSRQETLSFAYLGVGVHYLEEKNTARSKQFLVTASRKNPRNVTAYIRMGSLYGMIRDHQESRYTLGRALELDPNNEEARRLYSIARKKL